MSGPAMSDLSYTTHGRYARLALNRPDRGNRLTPAMAQELAAACEAVEDDDEVEILLLSGQGETFCTGLECSSSSDRPQHSSAVRSADVC